MFNLESRLIGEMRDDSRLISESRLDLTQDAFVATFVVCVSS